MSTMKLTLIGLETYLHQNEQSLFDELVLPDGINKEDVTNNILLSSGEFEALYSEPYFLRSAIGLWGRKHYRTFEKWVNALNLEYNPLENYDRIENWADESVKDGNNLRTLDHQDRRTLDSKEARTIDTQDELTLDTQNERTLDTQNERTLDTQDEETRNISDETTYDKDTTNTTKVSAFDSGAYQPSEEVVTNEDGTVTVAGTGTDTFTHTGTDTMANTGTDTMENTGTETTTHTGTDTIENSGSDTVNYSGTINDDIDENINSKHAGRIHGNIGVTTSQQMLQSELDIARFNLVEQITDLFVTEFCIMVYD